jgi:hypothetical protein
MKTKLDKAKFEDEEQSKRFIEAARELGADESGEAFERAFNQVVQATPPKPKPPE